MSSLDGSRNGMTVEAIVLMGCSGGGGEQASHPRGFFSQGDRNPQGSGTGPRTPPCAACVVTATSGLVPVHVPLPGDPRLWGSR